MAPTDEAKPKGGREAGEDSGSWGRKWVVRPRSSSVVTTIVINLTVLMFTALVLIAVFVHWTYGILPAETATHYAPLIIIPYIIIFGLTVAVYGWRLISKLLVRPLRQLIEAIHRVARGDLEARVEVGEENELGQLGEAFNEMTEQIELGRAELESRVAELARTNEQLAQAQREVLASEKLASVGRLAAGVAHEIGNPLASISGYLDIMRRRDYLKEGEQEMLARVQKEIARINDIIRELLDYSRPQDQSLTTVVLNDSITSALTLLRAHKGFEHISLSTELEPVPPILANRSSLQQLIMNLVINAIQAMPEGGKLAIATNNEELGGRRMVTLTVSDTGAGIEPEFLDQIFDPFFTTKEPGQGTGLGLSICQRIVENIKGTIKVESEPGRGAAFTVRLPAFEQKE